MTDPVQTTLVATEVVFFAKGDERSFFDWLRQIPCVEHLKGVGRDLQITLKRTPEDDELRELIALFHRYGVDMRQLAKFETAQNTTWFRNRDAFWTKSVFG